jgi:hypothetical protein
MASRAASTLFAIVALSPFSINHRSVAPDSLVFGSTTRTLRWVDEAEVPVRIDA